MNIGFPMPRMEENIVASLNGKVLLMVPSVFNTSDMNYLFHIW